MEEARMVVTAHFSGDPSVEIFGHTMRFEFPLDMLDGDEDDSLREEIRDRFYDLVQVVGDGHPDILWFADECPECIQRLGHDDICHNPICPSYPEE